jgi:hypothetical protein
VTCDVFGGDPVVVLRSILNKHCEHWMGVIILIVADIIRYYSNAPVVMRYNLN